MGLLFTAFHVSMQLSRLYTLLLQGREAEETELTRA